MAGDEAPRDAPAIPSTTSARACGRLGPSRRWAALVFLVALALIGWGWWHRTTRPEYRMERARAAMCEQDWERAAVIADELEAAGHADRAHLLRGESLFHRGRHAAALAHFNRIQDQGAIRLAAVALSARCLLQLGETREAYRAFRFVLDQEADNVDAHRGLGAIAYDQGNLDQAVHHLREVARLDPRDGRPLRLVGLIHKDLSQFAQADSAYTEALSRELPSSVQQDVYLELAECRVQRREYASALSALDERHELGGEGPEALACRGEALVGLGRGSEALTLLARAVRDHPSHPRLLGLCGQFLLTSAEADQAVRLLERAVRADPYNHRWRYQLALAYGHVGRKTDAAEQGRRAKEIERDMDKLTALSKEAMAKPWVPEVRSRLAEVCRKLGKHQLAVMWDRAADACRSGQASRGPLEK
jgi:Flp pilus assembly protein TadD